jgi:hypothetical protein
MEVIGEHMVGSLGIGQVADCMREACWDSELVNGSGQEGPSDPVLA